MGESAIAGGILNVDDFGAEMAVRIRRSREARKGVSVVAVERREIGNGTVCMRYLLGGGFNLWVSVHPGRSDASGAVESATAVICKPSRALTAPRKDFRFGHTPKEAADLVWDSVLACAK